MLGVSFIPLAFHRRLSTYIKEIFLTVKNVYSVFRFSPSAIGFAPLAAQSILRTAGVPSGNATIPGGASVTGSPVLTPSTAVSSIAAISTAAGVVPSSTPSKAAISTASPVVSGNTILLMGLVGLVTVIL